MAHARQNLTRYHYNEHDLTNEIYKKLITTDNIKDYLLQYQELLDTDPEEFAQQPHAVNIVQYRPGSIHKIITENKKKCIMRLIRRSDDVYSDIQIAPNHIYQYNTFLSQPRTRKELRDVARIMAIQLTSQPNRLEDLWNIITSTDDEINDFIRSWPENQVEQIAGRRKTRKHKTRKHKTCKH